MDYKFERRTALLVAVAIVATVLYLVIRNKPFSDPNLVIMLRILLALACGVLGFSIPGFLEVKYNLQGFAIRASGAAAFFVITFFGTPHVSALHLADPDVELDAITLVDLRSAISGAGHEDAEVEKSTPFLTVPLSFRSTKEPARRAIIEETTAELSIDTTVIDFEWDQFVEMYEENFGKWLGSKGSVHPLTVEPGSVVHEEVLHRPTQNVTWHDIAQLFSPGRTGVGSVTVRARTGRTTLEKKCQFDLKYWSTQVQNYIQTNKRIPARITMNCTPVP